MLINFHPIETNAKKDSILLFQFFNSLTWNSVEDILQVLIVFVVESLELDFALLFPERHILLRVLPVLVVLVTSSEKDSESLYKRVKINRLINIFKVLLYIYLMIMFYQLVYERNDVIIRFTENFCTEFFFLVKKFKSVYLSLLFIFDRTM